MAARWFANNVGLMLLSLLLAFFVWALASLQEDPILENSVSANVIITGQPASGEIVSSSTLPPTVTLRLRAPQSVFNSLEGTTIQVPVDLSTLGVGEHELQLVPKVSLSPAQLLAARPVTATVTIEKMVQRAVPVRVSLLGTPAIGYRALPPTINPEQVVISGTQQLISKVVTIDAIVSVDNVRTSVEQTVRLVARDENEALVGALAIFPDTAVVRVPMEQLSNYRDVAVCLDTTGTPENGYEVTNVDYTPQVVTVFGRNEDIQKLPGCIETLAISLEGAKQDVEQRVGLNVPPNVSLVSENQSVQVRVRIQAQQGARTVSRPLEVIGVNKPLTSTISPRTVDIVLSGALPELQGLSEADVRVQVDATGLPAGVHQVTPIVIKPDGITVQSVLPATVQVEVRDERGSP